MNIAFYFPYPSVGGVSILFLRAAEYLATANNVFVVDLNDGYMATNCPSACSVIDYRQLETLPHNTTLITQSCPLWRIPFLERLPSSTKIVFWNLHPYNLNPTIGSRAIGQRFAYFLSALRKRKLRKLLKIMHDKHAIFFMDQENKSKTEKLLDVRIFNPQYLPIFNSIKPTVKLNYQPARENEVINCISVGRIEDFKMHILSHLIARLENLKGFNIHLTVVGQGSGSQLILKQLSECKKITYTYIPELHFSALPDEMAKNKIAFSMGTSALDSASIGLPTVCLDYSYKSIEKLYKFYFLYERTGFNLGCEVRDASFEAEDSLPNMFERLLSEGQDISERTYQYYINNHSQSNVDKLEALLKMSGLKVNELLNYGLHYEDVVTKAIALALSIKKIDNSGFIKI